MAYREVSRVEIAEVVRRWQSGISQRGISTGTGLSRATVRRYIEAVVEAGLARDGPAPSEDQLARLAGLSLAGPRKVEIPTEEVLASWADQVYEWLTADRLQVTRIHELLAGRGCRVSYTSLRRSPCGYPPLREARRRSTGLGHRRRRPRTPVPASARHGGPRRPGRLDVRPACPPTPRCCLLRPAGPTLPVAVS